MSEFQVRIEIEHDSVIKRWLSKAIIPRNGKSPTSTQMTGRPVTLERTTRSGQTFKNNSKDIKGMLCMCKSSDENFADNALSFASKAEAQALLTTRFPDTRTSSIPTILIPRDLSVFVEKLPSKPKVTVVLLNGSYTSVNVTLMAKRMSDNTESVEWESKMFIPVTLVKETTLSLEFAEMMDITRYAFRDHQNELSSLDSSGVDDDFSGKICLFNATHSGDANRAVELATKHGVRALILVGKDIPDRNEITLPVLNNINRERFMQLKKAGLDSTGIDFGLTIDYTGEDKSKPSYDPQSMIDPPETPHTRPQSHKNSEQKKDPPAVSQGFLGGIKAGVKAGVGLVASVFVSYTPKSGKEFNEVIKGGTAWSFEGKESSSYRRAIEILDKIDNKIDKKEEQEQEMEVLIKAVAEMATTDGFVGDVLILLFCHRISLLAIKLGVRSLGDFYDAMIEIVRKMVVVVDTEGFNLTLRLEDNNEAIDQCICHLTKRLSHKADNISKHSVFVLNAIWIRSHVCQALRTGSWEDLRQVTTLKHMTSYQSAMLSFMGLSEYNTLLITSIARDQDLMSICEMFNKSVNRGEDIPLKFRALRRLQAIYEINKSSQEEWRNTFNETRELIMLNIIGKLDIYHVLKKDIIGSVIKSASFESLGSFDALQGIFSSLSSSHTNYDLIVQKINASICSSLSRTGKQLPSLMDVSNLLHPPISSTLLNDQGWKALLTYMSKIKETGSGIRYQIELLSDVYDLFLRDPQLSENRMNYKNDLENIILLSVKQTGNHFDFAVASFEVSNKRQDMFMGSGNIICHNVAKIIIDETGLASTIRESPTKLKSIPSLQLVSEPGASLIECLSFELFVKLQTITSNIESAVLFRMRASSVESQLVTDIASSILISSFSQWSPSSMEDLLKEDTSTLQNVHTLMTNASLAGVGKARQGVTKLKSIPTKWVLQFNQDAFDANQLDKILIRWTEGKRDTLKEISGQEFPSKVDIEKKILEIKNVLQATRSRLTFHFSVESVSIRDIALAYRLNTTNDSLLHELTSLFFEDVDPLMPLALINTYRDKVDALVSKHGRELNAAAYFMLNKSFLFHHYLGSRAELEFDVLLDKLSTIMNKLEWLLSSEANFSLISEAANVFENETCNIESELEVIRSFPHLATDGNVSTTYLQHSMTVAIMSKPLKNFIASCTAYKFAFVTADVDFSELSSICNMLEGDEGLELNASKCYRLGNRIADILVPDTSALDLTARLNSCLPTFQFFDELRFCSATFALARERMWLGEDGLQTFYQEYSNVSNMFTSNQESFESEILNRLEPTIRAISSIGGALDCTSVATLLSNFKGRDDIFKVEEMRLIQANICKIQDWFNEGMDDVAAIHSKFAMIMKSGRFILKVEMLDVSFTLQYSRSPQSKEEMDTMSLDKIEELVQYLGFTNHNEENSLDSNAFIDMYRKLLQIKDMIQLMLCIGYRLSASTMEYDVASLTSPDAIEEMFKKCEEDLTQCENWRREMQSRYKYSLLFYMDELSYIYQCLTEARCIARHENEEIRGSECVARIMEAISRLSFQLVHNSDCLELIIEHINIDPPDEISWLEDVSRLVHTCGVFCERLNLDCFKTIEAGSQKKIVIHKIRIDENMMFSAPLRLLQHIYKKRAPASFQLLDGASINSSSEIHLFLERVLAFPNQSFTILRVDELNALDQEIIANFLALHASTVEGMLLHTVQLKDTILHAPPGVDVCLWDDSKLPDNEEHIPWLQKQITDKKNNKITVVSGSTGSGKTALIRREMKNCEADSASIYIHEDFSMSTATSSLRTKFQHKISQQRAIHFGISLDTDETPEKGLLLSINNFFNSFLLLGTLYDSSSGNCFHSGVHVYRIFVEVTLPGCEESCQSWLSRYIPILSCSCDFVQPPSEYLIDDQTRRVCTYLRAYDDGTINRKFNPVPINKTIYFVLDCSGSMGVDLGGRNALEVATDCMLSIFESHVQEMDHVGLIRFNHTYQNQQLIPLQQVTCPSHKNILRDTMYAARLNPDGGTAMYSALSYVVDVLNRSSNTDGDTWIICLTDGVSADTNEILIPHLRKSPNNLHIGLIGVNIDLRIHEAMNDLCRKYQCQSECNKGFFLPTTANISAIEQAFSQVAARIPVSQTFELDGIMSDAECRAKLEEHRPNFISRDNKILFSFWVKYLYRRCRVFDENEDFNYNENQESLGSSLMEVMLNESSQNLQRAQNCNWSSSNHTQLIYDFSDQGNPQFRLICTSPDDLDDQKERLSQLNLPGFFIPTTTDLRKRETLDLYLSQALNIPLNEDGMGRKRLQCIDDNRFVLTLDFCLKLLSIHERVSCGVPCIMEGETGVSKTALTKMYSILINSQQRSAALESTERDFDSLLGDLSRRYPSVNVEDHYGLAQKIRLYLEPSAHHNAEDASLVITDTLKQAGTRRSAIFSCIPENLNNPSEVLNWFEESRLEPIFFDINIHGSLTADELRAKVDEARRVARKLAHLNSKVVVFLDEVNTSSTLGLLKEMIVDHSFSGEMLESNIVLIAACNPVRNSISRAKPSREIDLGKAWASGHYQVKKLPMSLQVMTWDYGSLKADQEKEFIYRRILMMDNEITDLMARGMTEVISRSHELIRLLAKEHIQESLSQQNADAENDAEQRSRSVVSLRDIQRVFHLIKFFLDDRTLGSNGEFRRAMLISVGMVYYLRLDCLARERFVQELESLPSEQCQQCHLRDVLDSAIDLLIENTEVPEGVALTKGLKENVFMTMICSLSRTPLMIVGPPGCSKTLAVSVVTENANGEESPSLFYRKYARIQPFHYQCSKSSTSNEVASVFDRATQRQSNVNRSKQQCLVFMDEAGLPEEEKESLKVLHYLLEGHMSASPEVAFVCITNHILDAAKSNRCVCLLRPEPDKTELMCIALGVLRQKHSHGASNIDLISYDERGQTPEEFAGLLCECYLDLIHNKANFSWFVQFFGLRDFIHLIMCIRRTAILEGSVLHVSTQKMVHASS